VRGTRTVATGRAELAASAVDLEFPGAFPDIASRVSNHSGTEALTKIKLRNAV
jgi:hypothetical protein